MPRAANSYAGLAARLVKGDPQAAARAISALVDELPGFEDLSRRLFAFAGRSRKLGLCGPPGSGKSTLLGALITHLRRRGLKVGALVVDPSSPYTGGAFLGDRLRIQGHTMDPGVFIRSLATRGVVGGVTATIFGAAHVLEAWGADRILIETVGTGQDEVEIAKVADTVLFVTAPSLGDEIQAMKAGTMEAADVFVVNKADLPETERAVGDIRRALALGEPARQAFARPVLAVSALRDGGVDALIDAVDAHWKHLEDSGERRGRLRAQAQEELAVFISRRLQRDVLSRISKKHLDDLADKRTDPVTLGRKILAAAR